MSRQVLITPMSIRHANWADRLLPVTLTREQVKNSPNVDTDTGEWLGESECDCERWGFSSRVCDGCGSHLAGAREALSIAQALSE